MGAHARSVSSAAWARRWTRSRLLASEALDTLAAAGVPCTILKGMHTARRYYPEPGARPMGDIDVFVAPESRRAAEHALARAGWRSGYRGVPATSRSAVALKKDPLPTV